MRFLKVFMLASIFASTSISVSAQAYRKAQRMARYTIYADSVVRSFQEKLGEFEFNVENDSAESLFTPYMYRITQPNTFYKKSLKNEFGINWNSSIAADNQLASSNGMMFRQSINQMIDKALVGAYISNPNSFQHYDAQFEDVEIMKDTKIESNSEDVENILNSAPVISDVTSVIADEEQPVDIVAEKPNFWKKAGKFTTQFTQSYLSQNWYKGGNNNVTLLSTFFYECNYNDQKKIQWDNKLDLRLGFVSTPSDDFHKFMTNNDKIYLATKLGIKATKAWFYTVQGDVNSQFMPGYRSNKQQTFSKFLAPLDVFVSVGMDFKPTLKKGTLSVALLPLSYKYRLIGSDDEESTIHKTYNMKKWGDGTYRNFQHDFGSKVEANYKVEIVKNLTWRSRFYYYTTYRYAESEWENAFSFQFNKYFSTEVNALWRFDDNRDPKTKEGHKLGYFQFKEYFTFGLAYNF